MTSSVRLIAKTLNEFYWIVAKEKCLKFKFIFWENWKSWVVNNVLYKFLDFAQSYVNAEFFNHFKKKFFFIHFCVYLIFMHLSKYWCLTFNNQKKISICSSRVDDFDNVILFYQNIYLHVIVQLNFNILFVYKFFSESFVISFKF